MRTRMLALAAGVLLIRALPALPPFWLIGLLALGAGVLLRSRHCHCGLFVLGFAWACGSAQWAMMQRLPAQLDGQTLWVEGRVSGLPVAGERSLRFDLEEVQARRAGLPDKIRLSWYQAPPVAAGERWRLAVKLAAPRGLANPGGFDYPAWLLAQRVGATGSVKDGQRLETAPSQPLRAALRERLLGVEAQGRAGTLVALVLGDGSAVSRDDWGILQATGTVHLLVISGHHIGLLAGLVYGAVAGLARLGLWPRRWPWLPWACGLGFASALGYGYLAGFGVPVQRACIMLGLALLWRLRYRHLGLWWGWCAALVLVLLVEPLVSLMAGFWLSFGAVAVLILVLGGRLGRLPWWHSWGRAQWAVAVGLLPLLLALGLPVSLSAPLANLVAVPWVSLLVLPLALSGSALLCLPGLFAAAGAGLLWLAGGLLNGLFAVLAPVAERWPAWTPVGLPEWAVVVAGLGALLVLLPAGVPLRALGWPLLAVLLWPAQPQLAQGRADVWQLDVGQGLAVLVRTRHHALLYDAGPGGGLDVGERVVAASLRKLGVGHLDLLVISHAHLDHYGGVPGVRRVLPVARMLSGEPGNLPKGMAADPCESGHAWHWDDVRFSLWRWGDARESNPSSCVLLVEANGERLLLGGDIDAAAERAWLNGPQASSAHWLQSPHHGSRTSSSAAFLAVVQPRGVLISRGHNNTFGHPHPHVLARYQQHGIRVWDNAVHGALHLSLGAFNEPRAWRARQRFWSVPAS